MKIYLIRHSKAVSPGTPGYEDDSARPLTEKGREKMEKIASALKGLGIKPDLIVTSPYVRARQTAEILAAMLKYGKDLAFSDTLVPMGEADEIIGEIVEKFNVDELVLVSHEPCLSNLIGALTARSPDLAISLKIGGVCCLSSDDLRAGHAAVLEWLLTPKIMMKLS